jgi:hypothetical protein
MVARSRVLLVDTLGAVLDVDDKAFDVLLVAIIPDEDNGSIDEADEADDDDDDDDGCDGVAAVNDDGVAMSAFLGDDIVELSPKNVSIPCPTTSTNIERQPGSWHWKSPVSTTTRAWLYLLQPWHHTFCGWSLEVAAVAEVETGSIIVLFHFIVF